MKFKRLWHSMRIATINSSYKRADYCRKKQLFHHVGAGVILQLRKLPLYAELISIGDNVKIASDVTFVTHDVIHSMLNSNRSLHLDKKISEQVGCIEIGDNVFIGSGTTILYDVRIGSNVIIAADSVVTKDLEPNAVYAGVPARKVKSMDEFVEKIKNSDPYPSQMRPTKQTVSPELAQYLWDSFAERRK